MTQVATEHQAEPSPPAGLAALSPGLVAEVRRYLVAHGEAVAELALRAHGDAGLEAGALRARVIDGLLTALFQAAAANARRLPPLAIVAVGSYGRCTLAPHSDVDFRLVADGRASTLRALAEAMLYPLWDAGLNVGHQVVSPREVVQLAEKDLPTATTLLDARHVCGDPSILERLRQQAFKGPFSRRKLESFLRRLQQGTAERHERFGGSVFLLEPDLKNGAGGMRDLDVARWAAQASVQTGDFEGLAAAGLVTKREWRDIDRAYRFVARVRAHLHVMAGRRADRLVFDAQEKIATALGYGSGGQGAEAFMSDYYRNARAIERAARMAVARALPVPRRKVSLTVLANGIVLKDGEVALAEGVVLQDYPERALALYRFAVQQGATVEDATRQRIAQACATKTFSRKLRRSAEASALFCGLVQVIQSTAFPGGSILRELHEVGLLLAMVPEFGPVVGRVHHDIYHVYTVDVHSVAAVDRLRALCRGALAETQPLACRIAAEIARPRVVFFATLLHDVGKDLGGRNHSERGAEMCVEILGRLGFSRSEVEAVQHLIAKHLRMYHVATRRDVDDPQTLREFAAEVRDSAGLDELFLLTVADVSTTSPTALTSWKSRMLADLYTATRRWLKEGGAMRGAEHLERLRVQIRQVQQQRTDCRVTPEQAEALLAALPPRYVYANQPEAILAHLELIQSARPGQALIRGLDTNEPYVQLCVIADDFPGLLSSIAATFAEAKVKVLGAQIYSFERPGGGRVALDLFWVRSGRSVDSTLKKVSRLERRLGWLLAGEGEAEDMVNSQDTARWTARPAPSVETELFIDNDSATDHTIVEVITQDRRDLLYWLSTALYREGMTIDLAKINTEGERVADVFYVLNSQGKKLSLDELRGVEQRLSGVLSMLGSRDGRS